MSNTLNISTAFILIATETEIFVNKLKLFLAYIPPPAYTYTVYIETFLLRVKDEVSKIPIFYLCTTRMFVNNFIGTAEFPTISLIFYIIGKVFLLIFFLSFLM